MDNNTHICKPIRIERNQHFDYALMARAYAKYAFEIIDYIFVNNSFPSVK